MMHDLNRALADVIRIYFRIKHKAPNYTDTYLRRALVECMADLTKKAMYNHCIEVSVDRHEIDEDYRTWIKEQQDKDQLALDRLAKEDIELKDSVNMSLDEDNDRIIRIKEHMKKYDTKEIKDVGSTDDCI
jgi:hypothetical protein